MKDIQSRTDIETLVSAFYQRAIADEVIGYIFTEVARLDLPTHLPRICDFWETILLGEIKFRGNPMQQHVTLNQKERLTPEHFERWLKLWEETIHALFVGDKAQEAITRARSIAGLMQHKIRE